MANAVAGALVYATARVQEITIRAIRGFGLNEHISKNHEPTPIRVIRVNEAGEDITAEEAVALRHTLPGRAVKP